MRSRHVLLRRTGDADEVALGVEQMTDDQAALLNPLRSEDMVPLRLISRANPGLPPR